MKAAIFWYVVPHILADSEEHLASIFKAEVTSVFSVVPLFYTDDRNKTILRNVGMTYQTTRHHIPEDGNLHAYHRTIFALICITSYETC
jgi:hypothetical protein